MAEQSYDVIGAGFGGSSCAGLLAKQGLNVLLVEKNSRAGGKAMSLSKNGFTCTAWLVIGAPVEGNLYQAVLDELEVADLAKLLVPGTQGSMYRRSSGEYVRLPEMPPNQMDLNILFDWFDIDSEEDRAEALRCFTELTLMPPEEIDKLPDDYVEKVKSLKPSLSLLGYRYFLERRVLEVPYVGCDAGGTGVGTQQAIESGMRVAEAVAARHRSRTAA